MVEIQQNNDEDNDATKKIPTKKPKSDLKSDVS